MLARVFRGLASGFYIDVGAQDPRIDSVTKAFYDQGWRGINLEPVQAWWEKLQQDRPRDINLCLAAGALEGEIDFHEVVDTGLSTSSDAFAQRHQAQGHVVRTRKVAVRTLDAICAEHGVHSLQFLKIDAEGDEGAVLQGIDLSRLRPWVILVEATEPNSRVSTHAEWESLLLDRGYRFAYDDGLNRFYLADEHAALAEAFATPPNVFDDFVLRQILDHRNHEVGMARHITAIEELNELRLGHIQRVDVMIAEKDQALAQLHSAQAQSQASLSRLQAQLADREASVLALRADLAEREASLSALGAVLAEREASLSALAAVLAEREASLSALAAVLAEREASLSALRQQVAQHELELQVRKARITTLSARLQGSEQAVANLSRALLDAQAAHHVADAGWAASLAAHQDSLAALAQAQRDFQEILASRSWRITSPLRRLVTWALRLRSRIFQVPGRSAVAAPVPTPHSSEGQAEPESAVVESPAAPPRPLPISEDAQQILARCPILDPVRMDEGQH